MGLVICQSRGQHSKIPSIIEGNFQQIQVNNNELHQLESVQIESKSEQVQSICGKMQQQVELEQCYICKNNIEIDCIKLDHKSKQHYYHKECFIAIINLQFHKNPLLKNIKCKCGTIISTKKLREYAIPNHNILLSKLFTNQINIILSSPQLKDQNDFKDVIKQQIQLCENGDFFLINQNFLIYDETPE